MSEDRVYYIVNKHGLIFECDKDHFTHRVKEEVGYRAPSAEELKEYLLRQDQGRKRREEDKKGVRGKPFVQSASTPIGKPFTTDPDEAMRQLEKEIKSIEHVLPAEVDATDSAKELAEEFGIDLSEVKGSGAGGRIVKGDVMALVSEQTEEDEIEDEL